MFTGLTVFFLATNERSLLLQSMRSTVEACGADSIAEIIIVLINDSCPAAETCRKIGDSFEGVRCRAYLQKSADLAQVFFEIPFLANSSHFVIMAADLATDPASLRRMLLITREKPQSIVCASKWAKESVVEGYGFFRAIGSRLLNRLIAGMIDSNARDLFSFFEIYPQSVFHQMKYNPSQCLYEFTLRPVLAGVEYIEIPTTYQKRTEGRTNANIGKVMRGAYCFLKAAVCLKREMRRDSGTEK